MSTCDVRVRALRCGVVDCSDVRVWYSSAGMEPWVCCRVCDETFCGSHAEEHRATCEKAKKAKVEVVTEVPQTVGESIIIDTGILLGPAGMVHYTQECLKIDRKTPGHCFCGKPLWNEQTGRQLHDWKVM